jgi:hypothetical protein
MRVRRIHVLVILLGAAICLVPFRGKVRSAAVSVIQIVRGKKTVSERVAEFGDAVHGRLAPRFNELRVPYPPEKIIFVGIKQEQILEVWISGKSGLYEYLATYPILGASGRLGPKLVEGDGQVPEGIYRIDSLNPNSLYHLALRVDYPNRFDRAKGSLDGRDALGSDIMIHGKSVSIGCLAMGDQAAEDLFVMAAESGTENITVILSPVDFRIRSLPATMPKIPPWTAELYSDIRSELMKLKRQPDGAANRSQPVRSEPNRTSAAAGSGR